eukprot:m.17808 g.17808  ORF g.17808 m.17808 type:complete len:662 (+) comp27557_c0_seq1:42-2027(+)
MSSDELEPEHMRKIFIGGLDRETTNETLRPPFEPFGEIVDCVVIREGKTHGSRGFGFVTYATSSAVDDVMKQKVGFKVDGRVVDLKRAVPRDEPISASSTKVFVGGLPLSVDNDRLREYFSDFGEVAQTEVMRDRDGTSRGFGFVTFLDSDVVNKLANQKRVEIDGKVAEVKKAEPKGAVRPSPGGRRGEDRYDDYPPSRGRDYYGYDSYPRDMPHHHPHHHPHHQPHGRSDYQGSASMPPRGGYSGDFSYPYHGGYSGGPAAAAAAAAVPVAAAKKDRHKVLYEYEAQAEDELSLKVGSIVEILRKDVSDGWWEGRLNGKVGVFPYNFLDSNAEPEEEKERSSGSMSAGAVPLPGIGKVELRHHHVPAEKEPSAEKEKRPIGPHVLKTVERPPPAQKVDKPSAHGPPAKPKPIAPVAKPKPAPPPTTRKPPAFIPKKPITPDVEKKEGMGKKVPSGSMILPKKPEAPPAPAKEPEKKEVKEKKKEEEPKPEKHLTDLDVPVESEKLIHLTTERPKKISSRPPSRFVNKKDDDTSGGAALRPAPAPAEEKGKDDNIPPWKRERDAKKAQSFSAKEPEVPSSTAKGSDAGISAKELAGLKDELVQLKKSLEEVPRLKKSLDDFKKTFRGEIERLENELDEEKKERVQLQVEVTRLRKKNPVQ